jgi:hypothetical protein
MHARTFTATFLRVLISIVTVTVPATNGLFTTSNVLAGHCSTLRVARKGLAGINLTHCKSSQPCMINKQTDSVVELSTLQLYIDRGVHAIAWPICHCD